MLRTDRSALASELKEGSHGRSAPRQLLLAVAPPPHPHHSYALSGWPDWLIPAFRAGTHRPEVRLLEEER
jgi:hypothetical protein